jgi:hypothetical protein
VNEVGETASVRRRAYLRGRRNRRADLRRRPTSRYVWGAVPVISPYAERLAAAAYDGHVCQRVPFAVHREQGSYEVRQP